MRVLILNANGADGAALGRELADRYEVRTSPNLREGLSCLSLPGWRPDVVVTSFESGGRAESDALETLRTIQAAAPGMPILLRGSGGDAALRRQLDTLSSLQGSDQGASLSLLRAMLQQQQFAHRDVAMHRAEIASDIDRLAREAAGHAAERTIEQLLGRIGLDDEEGLRLAVRLAQSWESAKLRMLSAVATGIGSALLLALGAGLLALVRKGSIP